MQGREFKDAVFEQFARVASAFSSPKRLEIVDLLTQGERAVESIAEATGMTMANTSRHLQVLRQANVVSTRRAGIQVWYRVADATVIEGYLSLRAIAEARIGEVSALAEAFFGDVDGAEPVGITELVARANSGEVLVVDVRPRLEFEAGHLPGAVNIPLEELAGRISELDQSATVVAYCRGPYCVMSAQAVAQLRRAGLDAQRLDGGTLEWGAAGLPLAVGA